MSQSDNDYSNENREESEERDENDVERFQRLKKAMADEYAELDFNCDYSDNVPKILKELNISLAFTSYQAGRLIIVRSDGESLDVSYKNFPRPMGLTATEDGLTLGVFTQVYHFQREDGLLDNIKRPLERLEDDIVAPRVTPIDCEQTVADSADQSEPLPELDEQETQALKSYQDKLYDPVDERVDACYITRSAHYSGMINVHDIAWGDDGLWAVNSSFSCLCTLDPDYSFVPRWKPYFISELKPEDRCHLNGMALKDGKPAYVTTFSTSDTIASWRQIGGSSGTLMDVESNTVLVDGLTMPHSPRWHNGSVYYCNSGHGLLCRYDLEQKKEEVLAELPGFTRGIDFCGSLLFLGLSKAREGNVLHQSPLMDKYDETFSGIWMINLNNNEIIGYIKFTGNVDQIYDVAVLPNCSFPELIEPNHPRMRNHFSHPELEPLN